MKIVVAGSREIRGPRGYRLVKDGIRKAEERGWEITEVVSGTARGIDRIGEAWAKVNRIPIRRFPADWNQYGKAAGYIRNKEMARYADAAIIVWDGESPGTRSMIELCEQLLVPYILVMADS